MGEGPEMDSSVCMTWFYSNLTCILWSCFLFLIETNKAFIYCFIFLGLKAGHKVYNLWATNEKNWVTPSNDAGKIF